jgi:hypothetical protein
MGDPDLRRVEQFLSQQKRYSTSAAPAEIIGWVAAHRRPILFHWRGTDKFERPNAAYAGSGGIDFRENYVPSVAQASPLNSALASAVLQGITKVGKIFERDLLSTKNIDKSYGAGGEIIAWDGRRFAYVSDIGYFNLRLTITPGSYNIDVGRIATLYKSEGDYSIVQTMYLDHKIERSRFEVSNAYIDFVTSMFEENTFPDGPPQIALPFAARYWHTTLLIQKADCDGVMVSGYSEPAAGLDPFLKYDHDRAELSLKTDLLRFFVQLYETRFRT